MRQRLNHYSGLRVIPQYLSVILLLPVLSAAQAGDDPLFISVPARYPAENVNEGHFTVNPEQPNWKGARHDVYSFMVLQTSVLGLLYVAPESISGWSDEQREEYSLDQWKENVVNPSWDKDDWWINYLLHPYWGATYFIRARERGLSENQAFWFSVLLSTLYEYGGEALFEEPSIQDLIVTPVAGSLLGKWFEDKRRDIASKGGSTSFRKRIFMVLTDPMGSINKKVETLFGRNKTRLLIGFNSPHLAQEYANQPPRLPLRWNIQISLHW